MLASSHLRRAALYPAELRVQRGRVGDLGRRAEDTCRGCVAQGLDVPRVWPVKSTKNQRCKVVDHFMKGTDKD
mgnify:CR=1 FL=1